MPGRAKPAASAEAVASSCGSRRHGRNQADPGARRGFRAEADSSDIALHLLSGFGLTQRERRVEPPPSAQRVAAFLALQKRPVHRVYIAGNLWPDLSEPHATASLRTALWRLRRCGCDIVQSRDDRLGLRDRVRVDIQEVATLARDALHAPHAPSSYVVQGLSLAGDILPDWYEDWLVIERERFRQLRLHALEAVCERLVACGRLREALDAALAAVAAEPLRESAHRALISVYYAEGNRSDALRQYALFRDLLHDKLELEPSPQIRELVSVPALTPDSPDVLMGP